MKRFLSALLAVIALPFAVEAQTGLSSVIFTNLNKNSFTVDLNPAINPTNRVRVNLLPTGDIVTYINNALSGVLNTNANWWKYDTNTGVLSPSIEPAFVAATNVLAYGLYAEREFMLVNQGAVALALGANDVPVAGRNTISVNGTTTTADDSLLNIDNGNGFGQLLILRNNSTNAPTFTMHQTQVQTLDATKTNRLKGDWIPQNRGESLWLWNDGFGFVEVDRTESITDFGSVTNIFQNIVVTNLTAYEITVTNVISHDRILINPTYITINGTNVPTINPTDGYLPYRVNTNTFGDSTIQETSINSTLVHAEGAAGYFAVRFDVPGNLNFFVDTNHVQWAMDDSSTNNVIQFLVNRHSGYGGTGGKVLSDDGFYHWPSGGITINPTDTYIPVRTSTNTFADSPWYVPFPNSVYADGPSALFHIDLQTGISSYIGVGTGTTAFSGKYINVEPANLQASISPDSGFLAQNVTAASAIIPVQNSAPFVWTGGSWNSTASASEAISVWNVLEPISNAGRPTGFLSLYRAVTNETPVKLFSISSEATWPNDATKYFDGSGHWSVPAGGGGGGSSLWTNLSLAFQPIAQYTNFYLGADIFASGTNNGQNITLLGNRAGYQAIFDSATHDVFGAGFYPFRASVLQGASDVSAIGQNSLATSYITNSADIHGWGNYALFGLSATNSSNIYGKGHSAGQGAVVTASGNLFFDGNESGLSSYFTNSFDISVFNGAFKSAGFTNSQNIIGLLIDAGSGVMFNNSSNLLIIGTGSKVASGDSSKIVTTNMQFVGALNMPHVFNAQNYGWIPDGTDRTSAATNLLQIVSDAGGGEIYFPPSKLAYRADGQLFIPQTDTGTRPIQVNIRFQGPGGGNNWYTATSSNAAYLDLRYTGTNGGKIETRGRGVLLIHDLGIMDGNSTTNSTPLVHTSNTVLDITGCTFIGAGGLYQDAIVLGGVTAVQTNTVDAGFQGYGTRIVGNHFTKLNRGVYGLTWANSSVVSDNTFQGNTGTVAIEFDGTASPNSGDYGNIICNNTIEMDSGYIFGIKLTKCQKNTMRDNSFYDQDPGVAVAGYCLTNSSFYNIIETGYIGFTGGFKLVTGEAASMAQATIIRATGNPDSTGNGTGSEFQGGLIVKGTYDSTLKYKGIIVAADEFNPTRNIAFGYDNTHGAGAFQAWNNTTAQGITLNALGGMVGVGVLSPTSTLQVAGSFATSVAVGGDKTLGDTNATYWINVDGKTATLPSAASLPGRIYRVGVIAPANTGTISGTINGSAGYSLTASNKFAAVQSDGTNWWVIGNN